MAEPEKPDRLSVGLMSAGTWIACMGVAVPPTGFTAAKLDWGIVTLTLALSVAAWLSMALAGVVAAMRIGVPSTQWRRSAVGGLAWGAAVTVVCLVCPGFALASAEENPAIGWAKVGVILGLLAAGPLHWIVAFWIGVREQRRWQRAVP